ncbi:hypothetical protein [Bacillus alkalicellulosilyticus]|uniref:hypothetical protein n=1 Tax=Alkalihalobacterium alkalicellulosilyticum TaxID=1912214 RepID=UPI000996A149|nr:hypothetical protein [Bacillus alkalicellulosilyticus]
MTVSFTRIHIIVLVLILALVGGGGYFLYNSYFSTLVVDRETLIDSLQVEQAVLEESRRILRQAEAKEIETSFTFQKKLPVTPLMDQFLLHLARAEILSGTYISSLDITDDRIETSDSRPLDILIEMNKTDEEREAEAAAAAEAAQQQEAAPEEAPAEGEESSNPYGPNLDDVKQIHFQLTVRAKEYKEIATFLRTLDSLPRLVNINMVTFIGHNEQIMIDDEIENLEFLVNVSTFYYPELEELKEETPKVDYERPSEKEDPLYEIKRVE